jgi:hypothetical protein
VKLPDFSGFAAEVKRIVTEICDRPGHREQWAILLSGLALYPSIGAMIGLLVWFGMNPFINAALVIPWFGWIAVGFLILFGVVVLALLKIVRSLNVTLPNGIQMGVDLVDSKDTTDDPSH